MKRSCFLLGGVKIPMFLALISLAADKKLFDLCQQNLSRQDAREARGIGKILFSKTVEVRDGFA